MNTEWDDTKLRQLYSEQRQQDAKRAPALATVLARTPAAARDDARPWWRLVPLATAAVVLVVLAVGQFALRQKPVANPAVVTLTEWESPTDYLLDPTLLTFNSSPESKANQ